MNEGEGFPVDSVRVPRTFPKFTAVLVITTICGYLWRGNPTCSSPLDTWIAMFVARHIAKAFLYHLRIRRATRGDYIPSWLALGLAIVDMGGPVVWVIGGFYIFRADTCDTALFLYAAVLWGFQTLVLLLPCCFLSTIIFCAPCLLWWAPYIVRPNPNSIATGRDVMSKIRKMPYDDFQKSCVTASTSCPICLGDYEGAVEVMHLPCGHLFHSVCISEWACVSQLCPICRDNIVQAISSIEGQSNTVADNV